MIVCLVCGYFYLLQSQKLVEGKVAEGRLVWVEIVLRIANLWPKRVRDMVVKNENF